MQKTIQMNRFYSLLNASTGSCFAAFLDGIIPPINVKIVLNTIKIIHAINGSTAVMFWLFVTVWITLLIGINNNNDTPTPINPDKNPIINVSSVKIIVDSVSYVLIALTILYVYIVVGVKTLLFF